MRNAEGCLCFGALSLLIVIAAADAALSTRLTLTLQQDRIAPNPVLLNSQQLTASAAYDVSTIYRGLNLTDVIPYAIAEDPAVPGRIFASDTKASAIYMLDTSSPGATWQLYAGSPHISGWSDGQRSTALLHSPKGLCVGPKGHLFFLDHGITVAPAYVILRRVDAQTGEVTTIAGSTSKAGFEDGEGPAALFATGSVDVSCLANGQVLVNDMGGHGAIRRVTCVGDGCVAAHTDPGSPCHKSGMPTWLALGLGAALGSALTAAAWTYYAVICIKVQEAVQMYRERLCLKGTNSNAANLLEEGGAVLHFEGAEPQLEDSHVVCTPLLLPATISPRSDVVQGGLATLSSEVATATTGGSATAADLVSLGSTDGSYVNLIDLDTAEEAGGDASDAAASASATAAFVAAGTPAGEAAAGGAVAGGAPGEVEVVPGGVGGGGKSLL